jgi:hypothetical protein
MRACDGSLCCALAFRETLVAHLYGFRTVVRQGVLPGGSEAILRCGMSYLLALHGVRLLAVLGERAIGHEQNEARYKSESRHGRSTSLLDAVRYCELANRLLVASRTYVFTQITRAVLPLDAHVQDCLKL